MLKAKDNDSDPPCNTRTLFVWKVEEGMKSVGGKSERGRGRGGRGHIERLD
jgi:hypothetical protein